MKKLFITLCFAIVSATVFAQNNYDEPVITFCLSGGADFAFLQVHSVHRQDVYTDFETPSSLGLNVDFKFNDYFSIRPGIFYAGKGGTMNAIYTNDAGNVSAYDDYKLHYLEVPLDFIGHLPVGDGANIFFGAGPYYAYGLGGTNNQTLFNNDAVNIEIKYGKNGDVKSSDYGATTILGFQAAKGWLISGNIDWGFTNILQNNNTGFDATQYKTITFYLSVGQSF
jgi:hypothetical protein